MSACAGFQPQTNLGPHATNILFIAVSPYILLRVKCRYMSLVNKLCRVGFFSAVFSVGRQTCLVARTFSGTQVRIAEIERLQSFLRCLWFQRWKDEYLTWNPSDYGGVTDIWIPAIHIWVPDIFINNL